MSQTIATSVPPDPRGLTWQKLILGDWSRVVRNHSLKRRPGSALADKPLGSFLTVRG